MVYVSYLAVHANYTKQSCWVYDNYCYVYLVGLTDIHVIYNKIYFWYDSVELDHFLGRNYDERHGESLAQKGQVKKSPS